MKDIDLLQAMVDIITNPNITSEDIAAAEALSEKIDAAVNRTVELMKEYNEALNDSNALYIISLLKPSLTINITVITATLKESLAHSNDIDRYTKARLGFDKEFAEEIIKTEELLAARIQVFLEEYNELAKNY